MRSYAVKRPVRCTATGKRLTEGDTYTPTTEAEAKRLLGAGYLETGEPASDSEPEADPLKADPEPDTEPDAELFEEFKGCSTISDLNAFADGYGIKTTATKKADLTLEIAEAIGAPTD